MSKLVNFPHDSQLPAYVMNVLQEFVSGLQLDARLSLQDAITVQVTARPPLDIASVNVQGRPRWRNSTITRAHPGGSAGTYTVWLVALDQVVDNSPVPFSDHTDY